MYIKIAAVTITSLALSACGSPRDFETTPVKVETAAGTVTCQLYTKSLVDWDRAIDRPNSMDATTADNVCRAEGVRRQKT
ncbi:hypothetical protein [Falsihalocynthiibacter arcticus]|uniref:Uncharacterized protein n=1 Tax=Falsihalocynthiibacter arcticus TaxID=1579316 RepID=A0A126UXY5_9RHOB|nr:hypothetical protein [Falsihalocynthiibacter arcticus]AML50932.1 hypothetical protein RC74_06265 [Falsihalocynthiibacter arcticus]